MDVLVTGAAGFIGGALASRLVRDGHRVTALVRDGAPPPGCRTVLGDLRDLPTVERALVCSEADAVFHLGAQAIVPYAARDPWSTMEDNVRGTYNVLEALRRHRGDATLVVASSDKAYGEMPCDIGCDPRPYREDDPMAGQGPYDASKSCADLIARSYARTFGLRAAVARCGNVYGPGDVHPTRLVPSVVADIVAGRTVELTSDGSPVRDYLYVDDAVEGYLALERHLRVIRSLPPLQPAYNFAGGEPVSALRLAELAIEVAAGLGHHSPGVKCLCMRGGEIRAQALDCSLAASVLGWRPRVSLREGLRRTIAAALSVDQQGPLRSDVVGGGVGLGPSNGNAPG